MTVTSDSACRSPANSSVWWSSTENPPDRTSTLRIWRSIGSSQSFASRSVAFNSWTVHVGMTSTLRSPPSKVFSFSWRGMTAMACQKSFNKKSSKVQVRFQNLRCVREIFGTWFWCTLSCVNAINCSWALSISLSSALEYQFPADFLNWF